MIEDLHRIGVRLSLDPTSDIRPGDVIATFHRWIQTSALPGVLIDVADYSHVPDGPGVLLIAHEGNWAADVSGTNPGVSYVRKARVEGSPDERIVVVMREALRAAALLEEDETLRGRVRYLTDRLLVFANDRCLAPHNSSTRGSFEPMLGKTIRKLYGNGKPEIESTTDPRSHFGLTLRGSFGTSPREALIRLEV